MCHAFLMYFFNFLKYVLSFEIVIQFWHIFATHSKINQIETNDSVIAFLRDFARENILFCLDKRCYNLDRKGNFFYSALCLDLCCLIGETNFLFLFLCLIC